MMVLSEEPKLIVSDINIIFKIIYKTFDAKKEKSN